MIALYAGTFDPPTLGHLDLIARGRRLFDTLIVALAHNDAKVPLFGVTERLAMLQEAVGDATNVRIVEVRGLLVDAARKLGADVLLRGVRPGHDWVGEYPLAMANRLQGGGLETLLMPSHAAHAAVSSGLVRQIAALHGDVAPFVPAHVASALKEKFS